MDILFRQLVDSTKPSLNSSLVENLMNLYEHYEIEHENILTLDEIKKHLNNNIQNSLTGDQLYVTQLFTLRDQLLITHFVKKEKLHPYVGILEVIIDAIRTTDRVVSLEFENRWHTALQAACDLTVINPKKVEYNSQKVKKRFKRQFLISKYAKTLQRNGCSINIENGRVLIEESQARTIAKNIEFDIKLLGGIQALKRLFVEIEPYYHEKQGRYHLGRTFNSLIQVNFPLIPVGYLLNLCVKHPRISILVAVESPDDIWKRILQNSIALTCILDVQSDNVFALLFHSTDTITRFLQELAVYDNLFCPTQLRPSDVPKILQGLFSWLSEITHQNLGWTPKQAAMIAEGIFKLAEGKLHPITFQAEQLHQLVPTIKKDKVEKLLTIYSHELNSVNSNFYIPQDLSQIPYENYYQHKPLVRLNKNEYLFSNSSFCSPAFYEAIVAELRAKVDLEINNDLGEKIENFLKNEFTERGIKFSFGKYGENKKGKSLDEIDIVVEATDTLIFFEIKAKPLTRKARCGSDLNLFTDLVDSLLTSQIQGNKHEIFIRKNGSISLDNDSVCVQNGRDIARVSVTLLDFGSFQDRNVIFQFLTNILSGRLESNDNDNASIVKGLNKKLDEFKLQLHELSQLNTRSVGSPFYNCWFLSVPQLLMLLDNVNSSDDLKRELWRTRSTSTISLDFYREYEHMRQLAVARDSM